MRKAAVLESNAILMNELKTAIEKQGDFAVTYAGDDGEAGLKQVLKNAPDVAFVGTFLKGIDGCRVIREIKEALPACRIIATGVAGEAIIERAIQDGADYYLIKPFAIEGGKELQEERNKEKK